MVTINTLLVHAVPYGEDPNFCHLVDKQWQKNNGKNEIEKSLLALNGSVKQRFYEFQII